jgi:2-oxoisovalerate ferredoxin oxidoreductase alpha subunit
MCDLTMEAFELADKYRNPVVVLTDAVLGQMAEPLRFPEEAVEHRPDTSWAVCGNRETMKNLVTSIFLDFDELEEFNFYLQEKYARIEENEVRYEEYLVDDAEIVLVAYGISSRVARSAVETARAEGINVGLLRPITLFPFPSDRIRELADGGCRLISVEMSSGQMREDIRMASGCRDVELVNRMGGNLIELRDVLEKIREVAGDSSD